MANVPKLLDDSLKPEAVSERVERGSLRSQVTRRILTAVFLGRFPSGKHLVVQRLAELFEVSPTPVRESLVELAGIGLVDLLPNRGAVVRPFGRQEVREICQLRRLLEAEATREACGRVPPEELALLADELNRLQDAPRSDEWDGDSRAADTRLHGLVAVCCGSGRLMAEIGRYGTLLRTLRDVAHQRDSQTNYARMIDVPEHLVIVRALQACDPEAAAAAMDRHIRSAAANLEGILFGPPPAGGPDGPPRTVDGGAAPALPS